MKKTIIFTLALFAAIITQAQIDAKINPIGAIFGNPDLSVEFAATEDIGLEVGLGFNFGNIDITDVSFNRNGIAGFLAGKYYFSPQEGMDRFGIGLYMRYRNIGLTAENIEEDFNNFTRTVFAGGFMITQKWVNSSNVVFGIDFGVGRAFVKRFKFDDEENSTVNVDDIPLLNIDLILRFAVGYRF